MQVTREDHVERRSRDPFDNSREVAEKQPKGRWLIDYLVGSSPLRLIRRWVDPHHRNAFATQNDDVCLIPEKSRQLEISELRGP
jgi:hypothetical protein